MSHSSVLHDQGDNKVQNATKHIAGLETTPAFLQESLEAAMKAFIDGNAQDREKDQNEQEHMHEDQHGGHEDSESERDEESGSEDSDDDEVDHAVSQQGTLVGAWFGLSQNVVDGIGCVLVAVMAFGIYKLWPRAGAV